MARTAETIITFFFDAHIDPIAVRRLKKRRFPGFSWAFKLQQSYLLHDSTRMNALDRNFLFKSFRPMSIGC